MGILPRSTWIRTRIEKHSHNRGVALLGSDEEWRRTLAMVAVCVGSVAQQPAHYCSVTFPCSNVQGCGSIVRYPINRRTCRKQFVKHVHMPLLCRSKNRRSPVHHRPIDVRAEV